MSTSLEILIKSIKELPEVKHRAVAAIIGATVADAATRPLHWIYDRQKLKGIIGNSSTPEFWGKSECPFYTIPLGERTPYNDVMILALKSLNSTNGELDEKHLCESIQKQFGKGTLYYEMYQRRKSWTRYVNPPLEGPWVNRSVLAFLDNYDVKETGPYGDPDSKDNDAFFLILPMIVKDPQKNVWEKLAPTASLLCTNPIATAMFRPMTMLLSAFVQGLPNPITHMKEEVKSYNSELFKLLEEVDSNQHKDHVSNVSRYGSACYLPGSFIGAYMAMLRTDSYVDAVRLNITAGGDNGSRANIIGSCYGAKYGIDGIPVEWMKKVSGMENIMKLALNLISH